MQNFKLKILAEQINELTYQFASQIGLAKRIGLKIS